MEDLYEVALSVVTPGVQTAQGIVLNYLRRSGVEIDPEPSVVPGVKASYARKHDLIQMQSVERFADLEHYYSVLFHELAHSTGHPGRYDRPGIGARPGSIDYMREELTAELTAAFLDVEAGIGSTIEDHAEYQKNVILAIAAGPLTIMRAAVSAIEAADMILGYESQAARAACELFDAA